MPLAAFLWAVAGILLIGAEALVPGFWIFFFGAGGLATAVATWLLPKLRSRVDLQLLVWLASSSALLALLRRALARAFGGRDRLPADVVGAEAVVVEEIAPGRPGRVRFRGTTWRAESYDEELARGESVEILAREGLTLFVSRPILRDLPRQGGSP